MNNTREADVFAAFRIILGAFLSWHFLCVLPYGPEIFSSRGVLPSASANLTYGWFPSILNVVDSPRAIQGFLLILIVLSVLFALGIERRGVSVILWYGWACLYHRNNLIHNPSVPYIGWLLLACALIPVGEPRWPFRPPASEWSMPRWIYAGAWILLGVGYSLSGWDKLWHSPSWRNGDAVALILTTPLARDWWLTAAALSLPAIVLRGLSYATVLTELLFGPLVLWSRTRPFAWLAMLGLHAGILLTVDFADLTIGMLIAQLFVFDPRWLAVLARSRVQGRQSCVP